MSENFKPSLTYEIIRHIRPLYRYLEKAVEDRVVLEGLTVIQRAVMEPIFDTGPCTVPAIAKRLIVERQFIQRVANDLMKTGYMVRKPNPDHKRSWLLSLTEKGQVTMERIMAREADVLREVMTEIPGEDIKTALKVIAHLTDEFGLIATSGLEKD